MEVENAPRKHLHETNTAYDEMLVDAKQGTGWGSIWQKTLKKNSGISLTQRSMHTEE
jgi:hypothetical protein